MGLTKVTTRIPAFNETSGGFESEFLVDTGAIDSMAPADKMTEIGLREQGRMVYELADGTVKEYPFSLARIEFMGEVTAGRVVLGPAACEPILGLTALESVGIMVDPVNKTLKRLPVIPLKFFVLPIKSGQENFK